MRTASGRAASRAARTSRERRGSAKPVDSPDRAGNHHAEPAGNRAEPADSRAEPAVVAVARSNRRVAANSLTAVVNNHRVAVNSLTAVVNSLTAVVSNRRAAANSPAVAASGHRTLGATDRDRVVHNRHLAVVLVEQVVVAERAVAVVPAAAQVDNPVEPGEAALDNPASNRGTPVNSRGTPASSRGTPVNRTVVGPRQDSPVAVLPAVAVRDSRVVWASKAVRVPVAASRAEAARAARPDNGPTAAFPVSTTPPQAKGPQPIRVRPGHATHRHTTDRAGPRTSPVAHPGGPAAVAMSMPQT